MSAQQKAQDFIAKKDLFQLGELTTEKPHPKTVNLSLDADTNLPRILEIIKSIELKLVADVREHIGELQLLQNDFESTLKSGGKVFICGCGATGRLALTLEYLWRTQAPAHLRDLVIGFMAGGDVALVRSLERIEDEPDMGAEHLRDLGFSKNDLLIACTEGGETPFVIGATQEAASISKKKPYFLHCNPQDFLARKVTRSKEVFENPNINSISLEIDPMVLAGSTRLQATTALLLAVGSAIFPLVCSGGILDYLNDYENNLKLLDFLKLQEFIEMESEVYRSEGKTIYQTDIYGITILTDTTERSPTFSLTPFENVFEPGEVSLCYLHLKDTPDTFTAWQRLLSRSPRLQGRPDWIREKGENWHYGYDFSEEGKRNRLARASSMETFEIGDRSDGLFFSFRGHREVFSFSTQRLFLKHLLLKILLNTHSTLLMGRLHRYHRNIMTFVKPSCGKLVDRAIRNIEFLIHQENLSAHSYEDLAYKIFAAIPDLKSSEAIVIKVFNQLKMESRKPA